MPGKKDREKPVGEVLASTASRFSGEFTDPLDFPGLGTVVCAGAAPVVFGVLSSVETGSLLPARAFARYGLSAEELKVRHPEIDELITARFGATVLGARAGDRISAGTPGRPVALFSPVYLASSGEAIALGNEPGITRVLLASEAGRDDGFILAALSFLAAAREDRAPFLESVSRELSRALVQDYPRLEHLLEGLGRYYP